MTPKPSLQYACTRPISLPTPTKVQACPSTPREPKRAPAGLPSPASRVSGGVRARSSANAATASEPHPYRTARGLPSLPDAEGAYRAAFTDSGVSTAHAVQKINAPQRSEEVVFQLVDSPPGTRRVLRGGRRWSWVRAQNTLVNKEGELETPPRGNMCGTLSAVDCAMSRWGAAPGGGGLFGEVLQYRP